MKTNIFILLVTVLFVFYGCSEYTTPAAPPTQEAQIHPAGADQVGSPDFHGNTIRALGWDMRGCKKCHGATYSGGTSQKSCITGCHMKTAGPENCTTCHGNQNSAPPRDLSRNTVSTAAGVGAHQNHAAYYGVFRTESQWCAECHLVPTAAQLYDTTHLDVDGQSEVLMNGYGKTVTNATSSPYYTSSLPTYTPTSTYDVTAKTCNNTYCHGYFKNGNTTNKPGWTDQNPASCGSCHGDALTGGLTKAQRALPTGTHPANKECLFCHYQTISDTSLTPLNSKHINAQIDIAHPGSSDIVTYTSRYFHGKNIRNNSWDMLNCKYCHGPNYDATANSVTSCKSCHTQTKGPEDCATCHFYPTQAVSGWKDLDNNSANSARGMGAHITHTMDSTSSKPIVCADCHDVPSGLYVAGHLLNSDNRAEVVYNGLWRQISTYQNVTVQPNPSYDKTASTCSDTYCHGAFNGGNRTNKPVWNNAQSGACGTCHGDPTTAGLTVAERARPTTHKGSGVDEVIWKDCGFCHTSAVTVDGSGNVTFKDAKKHVNGIVER
jgi:predicted CxxxxCH...CXXCH cytochrome family protein